MFIESPLQVKREAAGGYVNVTVLHEILACVPPPSLLPLQARAINEVKKVWRERWRGDVEMVWVYC